MFRAEMRAAPRRLFGAAAAAVDLAVRRTALARTSDQREANGLRHDVRVALLRRLERRYDVGHSNEVFFRAPRNIWVSERIVRTDRRGHSVIDVNWPSDYRTFIPDVQERFDGAPKNATATARLFVKKGPPRPLIVLIHGYLGGVHSAERRIWPVPFFSRIGLDVALFVLPFHGPRAEGPFSGLPPFPGSDPRITNEGFRQAMADLRDFTQWALERGHPQVGVSGMSLGGYSTALAATVEPKLAFAIPIIPLVSVADVALLNGHLGSMRREAEIQHRALEAVYRIASPLHREPVIAGSSIFVIGADRDQITPVAQAKRLAEHFHCRFDTMHGGHVLQLGRSEMFRKMGRFLNELGVLSRRAARREMK
jgi:pimeloyl-ACP methyl ester carboxylesterase